MLGKSCNFAAAFEDVPVFYDGMGSIRKMFNINKIIINNYVFRQRKENRDFQPVWQVGY